MGPGLLLLALVTAAMTLTGCPGLQRVAGDIILPPQDEIALGRQLAREVEAHYEMHPDTVLQRYVSDLGAIIVGATGDPRPEIEFSFRVIDAPEAINAMALPGGWIYLYSGLIMSMENEAELVAVLAHEIAHVNLRHIAERLATLYGVEVLAAVALGQDAGTLQRLVASIVAQGYLLSYSRGQEREADSEAVEYAIAAGWDPRGLATFFERLEAAARPPDWLSTHPSPGARVEFVLERIAGREIPTRTGQQRFLQARGRLTPVAGAPFLPTSRALEDRGGSEAPTLEENACGDADPSVLERISKAVGDPATGNGTPAVQEGAPASGWCSVAGGLAR